MAIHVCAWLMLCSVQIMVFPNTVSAYLYSMIYIRLTWGKSWVCEMFLNGELYKE